MTTPYFVFRGGILFVFVSAVHAEGLIAAPAARQLGPVSSLPYSGSLSEAEDFKIWENLILWFLHSVL